MLNLRKTLGLGSLAVITITLILFVTALFVKGFTHDLLLESAIFLVSVKLIILSYRNSQGVESIEKKLDLVLSGFPLSLSRSCWVSAPALRCQLRMPVPIRLRHQ